MGMNYRDGVTQAMDEFDKSQVCDHPLWVSKAVSTLWLPWRKLCQPKEAIPFLPPAISF